MRSATCMPRMIAVLLLLGGCGGGGGSGDSGAPPVVTAPTPTPTPTPSPSPTATALSFFVQTGAPVASRIFFYDSDSFRPTGDIAPPEGYTDRNGVLAPGITPFQQPNSVTLSSVAAKFKFAQGVTQHTSQYVVVHGRPEARVLSPLTSLLIRHTDQARLKRQLGISGSLFGLQGTDPDLNTFNPQAEIASGDPTRVADGERMVAAVLRVQAIQAALDLDAAFAFADVRAYIALGEALNARGDQFVFTNERMSDLLGSSAAWSGVRPSTRSAAAHLVNVFVSAISVRVARDRAAQLTLALSGYLQAELAALRRADDDATAATVLALTTPVVDGEIARYAERLPVPTSGFFFPAPDFYRVVSAGPVKLVVDPVNTQFRLDGAFAWSPKHNDFNANSTGSVGFFTGSSTIESVSVPAVNAGQIAVERDVAGDIVISRLNGYRGVSYFDYRTTHPSGGSGSARVYISFR